jgi:hypothetical protein
VETNAVEIRPKTCVDIFPKAENPAYHLQMVLQERRLQWLEKRRTMYNLVDVGFITNVA